MISLYSLLLFFHVLGAVGIFAAIGIETVAMRRFRRAETPADAQTWMKLLAVPRRLGAITMLTILITGVWMVKEWWGPEPWSMVAFIGLVIMGALGGGVTGRQMRRLSMALPKETGQRLSPAFRSLQTGMALVASLRLRLAVGTGILALMTNRPGISDSVLTLVAALAAGLLLGFIPSLRRTAEPGGVGHLRLGRAGSTGI